MTHKQHMVLEPRTEIGEEEKDLHQSTWQHPVLGLASEDASPRSVSRSRKYEKHQQLVMTGELYDEEEGEEEDQEGLGDNTSFITPC